MPIGVRGLVQLVLMVGCLLTAVLAMASAYMFGNSVRQMGENFRGELQSVNLPCIRSTLSTCDIAVEDRCLDYCCPPGYFCSISPIVSLYCQDGETQCGDHNYCRDLADIPLSCSTETCQNFKMVERVSSWSFFLSCIGIFLDMVDGITIFTSPNAVIFKSGVNIFSSLMKWVAFGTVVGANTQGFISELEAARCYNADGMTMVNTAEGYFYSYATLQVLSASLSLSMAPISAYYGGKLSGVPYIK
mmetsp:Transcript_114450/g.323591  ORF Transcript_114450/g.323591 Transcript_114450/m.323591 type:complete len:246 (+) Transcript_114450:160-897(+)